jgi:hypothetical protein
LSTCTALATNQTKYKPNKKKPHLTIKDTTLWYRTIREAYRPPMTMHKKSNTNPMLTLNYIALSKPQDNDQDMADSISPTNNKRG